MSRHSAPASASALRIAIAPISIPVTPTKRPNGCRPTPTMATSMPVSFLRDGPEREGHDLVAVVVGAERHDDQFHLHAVGERVVIALGEAALDLHLGQLDVADREGDEGPARRAGIWR